MNREVKEERRRIRAMFDHSGGATSMYEYLSRYEAACNALEKWRKKYPGMARIEDIEKEIREIEYKLTMLFPTFSKSKVQNLQTRLAELKVFLSDLPDEA